MDEEHELNRARMRFRSIADLNRDILANLHRIPRDIDVVVGIPRSGLLCASLVALNFNLPLADVEGLTAGRLLASGRTKHRAALAVSAGDIRHILLIDDSIQSGAAMRAARQRLSEALPAARITAVAVYGADAHSSDVDAVFAVVEKPRIFQWNILHHKILETACVDIDGILCVDPTDEENDDGQGYTRFLACAAPLYRPTRRIGALVTSRLEKFRRETEAWLKTAGIDYDRLVMLDLPSAEARREKNAHASFKAQIYAASDSPLFIESNPTQAHAIAVQSRKPVLWLPGAEMMYHDGKPPSAAFYSARRRGNRAIRTVARRLMGEGAYATLKRLFKPAT